METHLFHIKTANAQRKWDIKYAPYSSGINTQAVCGNGAARCLRYFISISSRALGAFEISHHSWHMCVTQAARFGISFARRQILTLEHTQQLAINQQTRTHTAGRGTCILAQLSAITYLCVRLWIIHLRPRVYSWVLESPMQKDLIARWVTSPARNMRVRRVCTSSRDAFDLINNQLILSSFKRARQIMAMVHCGGAKDAAALSTDLVHAKSSATEMICLQRESDMHPGAWCANTQTTRSLLLSLLIGGEIYRERCEIECHIFYNRNHVFNQANALSITD